MKEERDTRERDTVCMNGFGGGLGQGGLGED